MNDFTTGKTSRWFIIIYLIISCYTCSTLEPVNSQQGFKTLTKDHLQALNGNYERLPVSGGDSGASDLFWSFYLRGCSNNDKDYIALKVVDERRIRVSLVHKDTV